MSAIIYMISATPSYFEYFHEILTNKKDSIAAEPGFGRITNIRVEMV